jgi:hypothetical protein
MCACVCASVSPPFLRHGSPHSLAVPPRARFEAWKALDLDILTSARQSLLHTRRNSNSALCREVADRIRSRVPGSVFAFWCVDSGVAGFEFTCRERAQDIGFDVELFLAIDVIQKVLPTSVN